MRLWAGTLAILAAAAPAVVSAPAEPPASTATAASAAASPSPQGLVVERVTVDELKKMIAAKTVLVVDVRSADAYKGGHIPGAVSAPLADIDKHVAELKAAKKDLVTYCT